MLALLTPLIGLATEAMKLANTKEANKYIDRMTNIKLSLISEEAKGYDSDDSKIESLYKELKVVLEAVQNEISLHSATQS